MSSDFTDPTGVVLNPDGAVVAVVDPQQTTIWDVDRLHPAAVWQMKGAGSGDAVAFSPNSRLIVCTREPQIRDARSGRIRAKLRGFTAQVRSRHLTRAARAS